MITALALQILFMLLGAGLGFALYNPVSDPNPIADLGTGAMIVQGLSAVLSLCLGGWVAGRFTPVEGHATGYLHGFTVWCSATVFGVLLVSWGAGWALGSVSRIVGGSLSLAGQPIAAIADQAADFGTDALKQSSETLASFTEEAMEARPADVENNDAARAKRRIGLAITRLFNSNQEVDVAESRAAVVQVLVDETGMSADQAESTVTEWTDAYEELKTELSAAANEAETMARRTADKAANTLSILSLGTFFGFLLGAVAASFGGAYGAKCALRCENRTHCTGV